MHRLLWFTGALLFAPLCHAGLDYIYVQERSDVVEGKSFGSAGPYERIVARATFSVDPQNPANRVIVDLDGAPKNDKGKVEFSGDLYVLKPRDPAKGNGTVLFEVSNRGRKGMLSMFNGAPASLDPRSEADMGDRYLMEQGYTLVWLGWQWDVPNEPNMLQAHLPKAAGITGLARAQFVPEERTEVMYLADRTHVAYPADVNDSTLSLTVRDQPTSGWKTIPRKQWHFNDSTHIALDGGFEPGRIYEMVYKASDPAVAGLGLAGIRDLISFLKYGENAVSVLGDQRRFIKQAIGFGTSQSGRFLRTFLYFGFNADEKGRRVFDALWPHVGGAGRGSFNLRFAQPSRDAQPWTNIAYPTDVFPFTDIDENDPASGLTDGLLRQATAAKVIPKIFCTNGSYEYWGRVAALIHTTPDGKKDVPPAADTRIYFVTGAQHGPGSFPPSSTSAKYMADPLDYRWAMRGLLSSMSGWVRQGKEPPASRYPLISKDELTTLPGLHFPKIPNVELPARSHATFPMDFGPEFRSKGIITIDPPKIGEAYPVLLPQVDKDGNEVAGLKLPPVAVPLGTYTGWNLRKKEMGAPQQMIAFTGSFFPFAKTKAERMKSGDPRLSLEERYKGREDYLAKFTDAANRLASDGYILAGDVNAMVTEAGRQWDYWMARKP